MTEAESPRIEFPVEGVSDGSIRLRLRADSDRQITAAKAELVRMSSRLHDTLRNAEAKESDVAQQIEAISTKEATIRKARILTWLKVRHMLHPDQRRQVEEALHNR